MKTLVFDIANHVPLFVTLYLRENTEQGKRIRSPAHSHPMTASFMNGDTVTSHFVLFLLRQWCSQAELRS